MSIRPDFAAIAEWIKPSSTLLDLGCGDGDFLEFIKAQRGTKIYGLEISDPSVLACVEKGLNVIQQDLKIRVLTRLSCRKLSKRFTIQNRS